MNIGSQTRYMFQNKNHPPLSKCCCLLAVHTTLISRNAGFPPEQVCANKGQFKATLPSQPHNGVKICVWIFLIQENFDNVKVCLVHKKFKNYKTMTQNKKWHIKYIFLYPEGHELYLREHYLWHTRKKYDVIKIKCLVIRKFKLN
jgi:hypothetical protein